MAKKRTKKMTRLTPMGRFVVGSFFLWVIATAGALVGYSLIGNGHLLEVFNPKTWIHLAEVLYNSLK